MLSILGGWWPLDWAFILLNLAIVIVRFGHDLVEHSWSIVWDLTMLATLSLLSNFDTISQAFHSVLPSRYKLLEFLGCFCIVACLYELWSVLKGSKKEQYINAESDEDEEFLKPLLFPSRTTHTRVVPKLHSFSYSYLLVGIPVGWRGSAGSMISADIDLPIRGENQRLVRGWFHIDAADHLDRGEAYLGLHGKLGAYLKAQGESPKHYPYAYLVTAPRFLGYTFNPVSFWYLYNGRKQLKAMILEVNNTFDERRMYFLKQPDEANYETVFQKVNGLSLPSKNFSSKWPKDFHVSPFNSRKGSYSLNSLDPFPEKGLSLANIYNTIILRSSENVAKITAKVFSTKPGVDPLTMSYKAKLGFLLGWWWVGFVTFPRIVKEAGSLFFQRKLHVWYRPEVLKDSIGRTETAQERTIEIYFRKFLKHQVKHSSKGNSLKYIGSSTYCTRTETFSHPALSNSSSHTADLETSSNELESTLELKILTPLFYSRLVRHAHITEFISNEMLQNDDSNRTFWTNDRKKLLRLMQYKPKDTATEAAKPPKMSYLYRIRWTIYKKLRAAPEVSKSNPSTSGQSSAKVNQLDIRRFTFSSLDQFVMNHCAGPEAREYRRVVGILLLSDRIAFGSVELLIFFDILIRLTLSYMVQRAIRPVTTGTGQLVQIRTAYEAANGFNSTIFSHWGRQARKGWDWSLLEHGYVKCLLWLNGVHLWAGFKKTL